MLDINQVKFDCRFFKGYMPCKYNKIDGSECPTCTWYSKTEKQILIIKLGAIGDVIRTTPLLEAFGVKYPNSQFTWITYYPDILPKEDIQNIYTLDSVGMFNILNEQYDIAINLDKDKEACLLLNQVQAKQKYGFAWKNGHISPQTTHAKHKIITGLFDSYSQKNTKSYLEEIFEICHLRFNKEPYKIRKNEALRQKCCKIITSKAEGRKVIGLNTGCGKRWSTRLWDSRYWEEFIVLLKKNGFFPMVLGGENEDEQNKAYQKNTGAYYPGHFSLEEFIAIADSCDIIVTQVSMMMHIATALKKPLLLMNNIFNACEFEMYGRGIIVEPSSGCECFYGNSCKREKRCMDDISVDRMFQTLNKLVH